MSESYGTIILSFTRGTYKDLFSIEDADRSWRILGCLNDGNSCKHG